MYICTTWKPVVLPKTDKRFRYLIHCVVAYLSNRSPSLKPGNVMAVFFGISTFQEKSKAFLKLYSALATNVQRLKPIFLPLTFVPNCALPLKTDLFFPVPATKFWLKRVMRGWMKTPEERSESLAPPQCPVRYSLVP